MESTDSSTGSQQPQLPPGFRFHPTDEELVVHYLKKKAASAPLPVSIIAEVDLYKFDPWELPAKATFGEQEWYFFTPRERKYPNGARPNRAATSGYWKATGTDKPILTSTGGTQKVGVKKALVFYGGKPPKGVKTNWIMHEYRLTDNKANSKPPGCDPSNKKPSQRLDDWVLCRIYKKNNPPRTVDYERDDSMSEMFGSTIPPSNSIPAINIISQVEINPKLQASRVANYGSILLENREQNLFIDEMTGGNNINNSTISNSGYNIMSHHQLAASSCSKPQLPMVTKADDDHQNTTSFATLLSQLPQTPSLHKQTVMGSLGDGGFRQQYPLPGLNWFS